MDKLCKDCKHFGIAYEPIKDIYFGLARCLKHDLVVNFMSHRELNRLTCVEEKENENE